MASLQETTKKSFWPHLTLIVTGKIVTSLPPSLLLVCRLGDWPARHGKTSRMLSLSFACLGVKSRSYSTLPSAPPTTITPESSSPSLRRPERSTGVTEVNGDVDQE